MVVARISGLRTATLLDLGAFWGPTEANDAEFLDVNHYKAPKIKYALKNVLHEHIYKSFPRRLSRRPRHL